MRNLRKRRDLTIGDSDDLYALFYGIFRQFYRQTRIRLHTCDQKNIPARGSRHGIGPGRCDAIDVDGLFANEREYIVEMPCDAVTRPQSKAVDSTR